MAGEVLTTVVGNVTAKPKLKETPSKRSVVEFNIAHTPRVFRDGEYEDGAVTTFYRVEAWGFLAEHIAESIDKGDRVIVSGHFQGRSWETKEGEPRISLEIEAFAVGHDLTFGTTEYTKAARGRGRKPVSRGEEQLEDQSADETEDSEEQEKPAASSKASNARGRSTAASTTRAKASAGGRSARPAATAVDDLDF